MVNFLLVKKQLVLWLDCGNARAYDSFKWEIGLWDQDNIICYMYVSMIF